MASPNPFGELRRECEGVLREALGRTPPDTIGQIEPASLRLDIPPNPEFGELSSSLCFELAQRMGESPLALAQGIVERSDLSGTGLIEAMGVAGGGYINFHADHPEFSSLTIESARHYGESYGYIKTLDPKRAIVEHTSVNPAGPIHIGTARNSVIGDSLSRLLRAQGHDVATHFYVDDVGRQIAVVVYGYQRLDQPQPMGKPDHWIGFVYAATSCIMAIDGLKDRVERLKDRPGLEEELRGAQRELDDWVGAAAELRQRDPELFDRLLDRIREDEDPEASIARLMRLYEAGDPETKGMVRRVVELCLGGFRETYTRMGIHWDSWDWESDLIWSGAVRMAVERLRRTPFSTEIGGTLALDVEEASRFMGLKSLFGVSEDHEIPPLILMRSDGTTLYTTRDVAYSLWKFERAERVINVIGVEQSLAQLQLRVAVGILSSPERAKNLIHYAYELVDLPGYRMSKRRGRYIALDEIVDEAVKRAREEVEKRFPHLPEGEKERISEAVGTGAIKYALISVAPMKTVVFTWEKALNFEMNSAPFTQYAHARACSILRKAKAEPKRPDFSLLTDPLEGELVRRVAVFPEVFTEAAEKLTPSAIAEFANDLAARFNSFYASLPVIRAETAGLRDARLALVDAVRITMRNALSLLGIEALGRM